jgi:hypothetical protein
MLLSIFVTLLAILAMLMTLVVVGSTGGFTGRVPGGPDAMGLVIPFFAALISTVAMIIGAWCCIGTGGLGWVSERSGAVALIASGVALGIGLAQSGMLIAWSERMGAWVVPAGIVGGLIAPLVLCGLLIACAWTPAETMRSSNLPLILGWGLAIVAAGGLLGGVYGLGLYLKQSAENAARSAQADYEREAEWERKRNRTPIDALREDYAQMSPATPLWVFVAALPDTSDAECRAFTIDRALQVPDFDADLARTLTGSHPRYRHGCLDLIRFATDAQFNRAWSVPLAPAIEMTAREIGERPDWFNADYMSNPNPLEHLRALSAASKRCNFDPAIGVAMQKLRAAIQSEAPESVRDESLAILTANQF